MPRQKYVCRREFLPVSTEGQETQEFECKHCKDADVIPLRKFTSNTRNMKRHLKRCEYYQKYVTVEAKENIILSRYNKDDSVMSCNESTYSEYSSLSSATALSRKRNLAGSNAPPSKKKFKGMDRFVHNISEDTAEKFRELLSVFIIEKGLPFSHFESDTFRSALKTVGMSVKEPTAYHVSKKVLPKMYAATKETVERIICNQRGVCFTIDGWTDINHRGVVNVIACLPKALMFGSKRFGSKPENSSNLYEFILDLEADLKLKLEDSHKPPLILKGLCTDSPPAMVSLRQKINDDKGELLRWFAYGCGCHSLNNLAKDFLKIPGVGLVINDAKFVAKYFKNKHCPKEELSEIKKRSNSNAGSILSTVPTRWMTNLAMVNSEQDNKKDLWIWADEFAENYPADLRKREKPESVRVRDIVEEKSFWRGIAGVSKVLSPIAYCLYTMERDDCPLSFTVAAYIYLKLSFKDLNDSGRISIDLSGLQSDCDKRWKEAGHPFLVLAFCLDPFWNDLRFSEKVADFKLDGKSIEEWKREAFKIIRNN